MHTIITGSSRGIGQAIAKEVCKRGGFYYGFSRWNDIDVSDYKTIQKAMSELEDDPPEVLINNAGIAEVGSIFEMTPEQWDNQVSINLNGVFYCCKEYARIAKDKGGIIINIASTAGLSARPGRSGYAATKAAVISFSHSIAEELKPYNIKVYCILPGACNTDMRHQVAPDDNFDDMLQPEELAVFICDLIEHGDYLDNQDILVRKNF